MAKDLEAPKPFVPSVFSDGVRLDAGNVEEMRFGLAGSGPLAKAVLDSNNVGALRQLSAGLTAITTIPVGMLAPYAGVAAPANWLLCDGSAVSRATYAALFAVTSTSYGVGDGSTTFNLPDLRGRVVGGKDDMGGTAASRLTATSGIVGTTLGATGGNERIQDHTHTFSGTTGNDSPDHSHTIGKAFDTSAYGWSIFGGGAGWTLNGSTGTSGASTRHTHTYSGTTANHNQAAGGASQNVQPTLIATYIIKAIPDVSNTFGVALAGAAGGDLSGSYPNPTVNYLVPPNAQTTSYTLALTDSNKMIEINNVGANNLTVPLNATVPYPIGTQLTILQTGAGQTTIVATGGVTINATPGLKLRAQWSSASLVKRGTDTWVAIGDLLA